MEETFEEHVQESLKKHEKLLETTKEKTIELIDAYTNYYNTGLEVYGSLMKTKTKQVPDPEFVKRLIVCQITQSLITIAEKGKK